MNYPVDIYPEEVKEFLVSLNKKINEILNDKIIGIYLHGSLAMGCFNPRKSDIDVLVVTNKPLAFENKRELANCLLNISTSPYPVEISFLNVDQLTNWKHPSPFDFHYSEFWRGRYEADLRNDTSIYINGDTLTDQDLAAHITILNHRGICMEGESIEEVFPSIPEADYLSSILSDFSDCLENMEDDPIYNCLNLIRVYWYLKEGVISSKLEAGAWGIDSLPEELHSTLSKIIESYKGENATSELSNEELKLFKEIIQDRVGNLL